MVKKYSPRISTQYSPNKKKKYRKLKKKLEIYTSENGKRIESSIERKVRELLESLGIPFIQEKKLQWKGKWKSFDFYVSDGLNYSFLIECDGDYWHNENGKTKIQKKNIANDKFKNELAQHFGIPLLRFKEKEIKTNINKIKQEIKNEIKRQKK